MNIGLKLWSNNTDFYLEEAKRLYKDGIFDYIELYVVPNTLESIDTWRALNTEYKIPFTLHAPHFLHGVNLAKREFEKTNFEIFREVKQFADGLNAKYIVVHSGIDGDIEETVRQLKSINEPRILIENKPFKALPTLMNGAFCRGASIEEIKYVIEKVGCGFCLDIGHAICTANSLSLNPYEFVKEFDILNPTCYHLSDNFIDSEFDKHLHFGQGNYNFKNIFDIIDTNKNIAIETIKESKENLNDFAEDVKYLSLNLVP